MDVEGARRFLRRLPHAAETMQWGANLVYWAGNKKLGGKMFALINLDELPIREIQKVQPVCSFYTGAERAAALLEREGFVPAPYFARIGWVALTAWGALGSREMEELLRAAHAGVWERIPKRTRAVLAGERIIKVYAARND